jgi:hypothetical protein
MERARKHARLLSVGAFCLLALVAELVGRSLTARIDVGQHVGAPGDPGAAYYPFLIGAVKLGIALLLARLAWRIVKARATALAGRRTLAAAGRPSSAVPRLIVRLSPRLWLAFFTATSLIYLAQTDAEHAAVGRWPLLAPLLHTSALPVFAVLSVLLALVWSCVQRWLADYERYAEDVAAQARGVLSGRDPALARPRRAAVAFPPRRLFGISFESRPPPLPA